MNLNNASASVETFKLNSEFQRLRSILLQEEFADRLNRPLAYWALPTDRRLPMAFLGRSLGELLATPFDELSATAGIGQKKIGTLIQLLSRAVKKHPPGIRHSEPPEEIAANNRSARSAGSFDPSVVSEALWEKWCETVNKHHVGSEKLGRLAPSLQALPTVIWNTPLSEYAGQTVADIRRMKTHGEKRTRTILEVFHAVHQTLSHAPTHGHLTVRLVPRFTAEIDRNISRMLASDKAPSRAELREQVVLPLVEQCRIDAGPEIAKLVEGRLGVGGEPQPVRHQSRRLGVTRARVYQLLETCADVMAVRWPEGGPRLRGLQAHLSKQSAPADRLELLRTTIELFFPDGTVDIPHSNGDMAR